MKIAELKDVVAVVVAASTAVMSMIASPQWPTFLLIIMVIVMGYVIFRLLSARQEQLKTALDECHEAHTECSERFQTVLQMLKDFRKQAGLPDRRDHDAADGPVINEDELPDPPPRSRPRKRRRP